MNPLPAQLPVIPITRPVSGEITLPGSKSITNRALILSALCDAPVTLTGALFSEDTALMIAALRQLGLEIETDELARTIRVSGQSAIRNPQSTFTDIHVGLAGTAARFLTALCAAAPRGVYRIDGVPQMRKRPMRGLLDALTSLGADIHFLGEPHHFPVEIHARGLRGGPVEIDATESSQMLSALLMISPLCETPPDIRLSAPVRQPFVEMTKRMMAQFGLKNAAQTHGLEARATAYAIEPDATAASYFLALPLVTGGTLALNALRGPGSGSLQGDTRFATVLTELGLGIQETDTGLTATAARLSAIPHSYNFNEFSDTFLTLAAIAPLLPHPVRITGIAHTRKQETDRVAGMARELARLGQHVIETGDSLEIHPRPLLAGQTIDTYHDHRFAMSFGILGCHDLHGDGRPWLTIDNPACCAKTFPDFFEQLEKIREKLKD
ncbi:3-phosphoshikimate 1-carboxyvinyltransferase [Ereboglobus sp. PH5-10]|uniref:3-phosphoshikimate 1-carboxyvinyltransferase n=1 Tax=Ereboglobus sp. PH5-10 TaxID=2940629 RepID=UPI0024063A9B|nr:3-phosphoshikimate 1-carboxyvinyltransferase [Ereboglobus sp. PH5-10]MDF9826664.1 3-phosphoshikimate 1-carboxyvinyltransferase [Ereboglobus sp. PH5-10]